MSEDRQSVAKMVLDKKNCNTIIVDTVSKAYVHHWNITAVLNDTEMSLCKRHHCQLFLATFMYAVIF